MMKDYIDDNRIEKIFTEALVNEIRSNLKDKLEKIIIPEVYAEIDKLVEKSIDNLKIRAHAHKNFYLDKLVINLFTNSLNKEIKP